MRLSKYFPRKSDAGIGKIHEALFRSSAPEALDDLPERFADLITRFEQADIHPGFRADIMGLLNNAVTLSYAMVNQVYEADHTTQIVSDQMAILGRLLVHLHARPTAQGFSILMAHTGQLVGLYATREEAERQLDAFRNTFSVSQNCSVVPARVTSAMALQPGRSPLSDHGPEMPGPDHAPDAQVPGFLSKDEHPLENALRPSLNLNPEADLGVATSQGVGPGALEPPPALQIKPRK